MSDVKTRVEQIIRKEGKGVNDKETTQFLALVKLAYPSSYKDIDKSTQLATISMWQRTFADMPYPIIEMAFDRHRMSSQFAPTVADIVGQLKSVYYAALERVLLSKDKKEIQKYQTVVRLTQRYAAEGIHKSLSDHLDALDDSEGRLMLGGVE